MKKVRKIVFLVAAASALLLAPVLFAKGQTESGVLKNEVVVWTYDSFVSEWGPGQQIADSFAKETGLSVRWESHGDAGELLSRLLLEGKSANADIILGLDQNMAQRAIESGLFEPYKPKNADKIDQKLIVVPDFSLIPFDYSYFSIVYDSEKIKNPPASLDDLCKSEFARSLILMDPRTSSPGLGFLGWTKEVYGDKWPDYWRRLQPSILTIAEGWSTGYGLFTAGEAPLVLSYTTSPGYHVEYEGTDRIKAAIFPSGQPIQIELAGLLKGASHKENAKKFLDFMVSPSFQSAIPLGNWMYPVIDIPLPASFAANPQPPLSLYPLALTETDFELWAQLFRK